MGLDKSASIDQSRSQLAPTGLPALVEDSIGGAIRPPAKWAIKREYVSFCLLAFAAVLQVGIANDA